MKFCRRTAGRGYILDNGLIQLEGTMECLWENEATLSECLGM